MSNGLLARCAAALVAALASSRPPAFAHARISPAVALAKELQLYSLAVPTEKEGATTTKIVLTVPEASGSTRSRPRPGWKRDVQSDRLRRGQRSSRR